MRQEPVLLAVDYENTCLPGKGINHLEKMLKLGVTNRYKHRSIIAGIEQ